jgi:preprotein translocase subunit SecB
MTDQTAPQAAGADNAPQAQFTIEKIYVKDVSFEAPNAPQIFNEQGQPQLGMNLNQKVARLNETVFEVVLEVTLTCKLGEKTVYLAEVAQAGIFGLGGFDDRTLDMMLGTYCPNVLFPYVRQSISDLIVAGGFPPFYLQPINFEGLYAEGLRRRAEQAASQGSVAMAEGGNARSGDDHRQSAGRRPRRRLLGYRAGLAAGAARLSHRAVGPRRGPGRIDRARP